MEWLNTVSSSPIAALVKCNSPLTGDDAPLRSLLASPELRGILQELAACHSSRDAAPLMEQLVRHSTVFRKWASACLEVVEPDNNTFKDAEEELDTCT